MDVGCPVSHSIKKKKVSYRQTQRQQANVKLMDVGVKFCKLKTKQDPNSRNFTFYST